MDILRRGWWENVGRCVRSQNRKFENLASVVGAGVAERRRSRARACCMKENANKKAVEYQLSRTRRYVREVLIQMKVARTQNVA